ncbi:hypothetical protein Ae201684P_008504 [Aphanomyces euteiches]|uniref:Uncharacterized protein n=1 Tax=Aphanomyces euteiches TaxID=100861 RepID=A0A6G0XFB0_9STRA|nr:hypothetical protein Ae201684_005392 [Aphanomyces euteiches]KAH9092836.1 hypothetical protein Ae201684P_008504 [Aphanomyces euteiches]KAH9157609.1 hypothetical protein AeRB84_000545 [Aphanomyces euteiches]
MPSDEEEANALARYTSYGFVLSSILNVEGLEAFSLSSEVYRWKLREIRTRMRHHRIHNDETFLRDVQMLLHCVPDATLRQALELTMKKSMASVGLGPDLPKHQPTVNPQCRYPHSITHLEASNVDLNDVSTFVKHEIELSQERKATHAQILSTSLELLDHLASPKTFNATKAPSSLLRRTSSSKVVQDQLPAKRRLFSTDTTQPKQKKKKFDSRRGYVPLEDSITDPTTLEVLEPRRIRAQSTLCPHLRGQLVTVYSAKRDRLVSEEPLGELRDGCVYDFLKGRELGLDHFFAFHVRSNRWGCITTEHICLLQPERKSIDHHLATCSYYDEDINTSDAATDEDIPLSQLAEKAGVQIKQEIIDKSLEEETTVANYASNLASHEEPRDKSRKAKVRNQESSTSNFERNDEHTEVRKPAQPVSRREGQNRKPKT